MTTLRGAFTLIEMTIATALSLVVMLVAYGAISTTTQTVTQINRQALQNRLMRLGLREALQEADIWRLYDDPDGDASKRGLRPHAAANSLALYGQAAFPVATGLPFTPLAALHPDPARWTTTADLVPAAQLADNDLMLTSRDRERGWHPDQPYQANDPRRWFRANSFWRGVANDTTNNLFGRYAALTNVVPDPVIDTANFGSAAGLDVTWTHYENRTRDLFYALGAFGALDYSAANQLLLVHGGRETGAGNDADFPAPFIDQTPGGSGGTQLFVSGAASLSGYGSRSLAPSPVYTSIAGPFGLLPHSPFTGAWVGHVYHVTGIHNDGGMTANSALDDLTFRRHHFARWPHPNRFAYNTSQFQNRTTVIEPVLERRPPDWPVLLLSSQRVYNNGHFTNIFRLRWVDSGTGERSELPVGIPGSTLRGARQQRHRDGGWAEWRGRNHPGNDPTLDSPP